MKRAKESERVSEREGERVKERKGKRKEERKIRREVRILRYNRVIIKNNELPILFNSNPNSLMLDNVSQRLRVKDPGYEKRFSCILFFLMSLIYVNLNIK